MILCIVYRLDEFLFLWKIDQPWLLYDRYFRLIVTRRQNEAEQSMTPIIVIAIDKSVNDNTIYLGI